MAFRKELKQAFGDQEVLSVDWTETVKGIRETGRKVIDMSPGMRKINKETLE